MESWNVMRCDDGAGEYVLLNKSQTSVKLGKRALIDLPRLLSRMEELGVPFGYTEELKEIYFTILPSYYGDYLDDKIRVSCGSQNWPVTIEKTLIHEIAHHMDDQEDLAERDTIATEKKRKARFMSDVAAKDSVGEYIAIGFETFYTGTREERKKMRHHNRKLYSMIKRLHEKYRAH